MAKEPSPFSAGFVSSVSGKKKAPVAGKPAGRPAPAAKQTPKPAAKPAAGIGLMPNYASIFKPFVGDSVVNQEERNALDSLFQIHTGGGSVSDQPDVHEALKSAGVLRFPGVGKTLKDLKEKRSPTYASAVDAVDALDQLSYKGDKVDYVAEAKREPFTKGLLAPFTQPAPTPDFWKTALSMGVWPLAERYGGRAVDAWNWLGKQPDVEFPTPSEPYPRSPAGARGVTPSTGGVKSGSIVEDAGSLIGSARFPTPTEVYPRRPAGARGVTPSTAGMKSKSITEVISNLPAGPALNLFSPLTDEEKKRIRDQGGKIYGSEHLGGAFEVYNLPGRTLGDIVRGGFAPQALEPVSQASAKLTKEQLIQRRRNEQQAAAMKEFLDASERHESSFDIQTIQEQSGLGPLTRQDRVDLLKMAKENGWDISRPRQYTDAELARRAFTRVNPMEEVQTGLLRQTGQLASLPAFLASAVEAIVDSAEGNPERGVQLVKDFFGPYAYVWDDAGRRGLFPALSSFVQERPLDALMIGNATIRGTGRVVGAGMRTVGGTGRYAPQVAVGQALRERGLLEPGKPLARVGEFARTERPVGVSVGGVEQYLGERPGAVGVVDETLPQAYQLPVGYTSANIFDTLALSAKSLLIDRGLKSGSGLAKWAATRRADRALRSIYTKRDAATAEATRALRKIGASLTPGQRERLTMELIRSQVDETGNPLSLSDAAAFWRNRAEQKFVDAANPDLKDSRVKNQADARLYERTAAEYERWANTDLSPEIIQQARDAMRPLGKNNDMYMAATIDSLTGGTDWRGVKKIGQITDESGKTRNLTFGDLRPGDYVDVGRGGRVQPALVTDVRLNADGSVEFTRQNLMDPADIRRVRQSASKRTVKLSSGATAQKYVRDFILLQDQFDQAARVMKGARTAEARAQAAEFNRPISELEKLDAKRLALGEEIQKRLDSMQGARERGRKGEVRKFARQYAMKAYALRETLVEMERLANEANLPEVAAQVRGWLDSIVIERRDLSGESAVRVADRALQRQDAIVEAIRSNDIAPVVRRFTEQPEAQRLLAGAATLEAKAARLQELEKELARARAEAPSGARTRAAERRVEELRSEVDALVRQAGEARRTPTGLVGVLDSLEARFDFVRSGDVRELLLRKGKFNEELRTLQPEALRVLGELRRKVEDGAQITRADLDALRGIESSLVRLERRVRGYAAYKKRAKLLGEPADFGRKIVFERVDLSRREPPRLIGEARAVAERVGPVAELAGAREGLPPVARLRDVRRMRKQALRQAELNRREAARIVERGKPIVNDAHTKVVLDAATDQIAVELPSRKVMPIKFKIDQMRNEAKNEFIARAEMSGDDAVLFLGTRAGRFSAKKKSGTGAGGIDLSPGAGIRRSRYLENRGFTYGGGYEDFSSLWSGLLFDSGSLSGNAVWLVEMRKFIEGIAIRVDNMSEAEAAAYNATRGAVVNLSESDRVVFDARRWVAVSANRDAPINASVKTGSIDLENALGDITNPVLADVFKRQASIEDVVNVGGDYYLIPEFLYNQIVDELSRIQYRPTGATKFFDNLTKQWRSFTLNIFPRTAFANLVGSAVLAALAGAGPRSFYLAYRHLKYGDVPGPAQLRQGYAAGLTSEMQFARVREALPTGSFRLPGETRRFVPTGRQVSFDTPFAGLAWWMNTMRAFNGVTEDFGRLAVWYSKAYPEASRLADESFVTRWTRGRELSEEAQSVLEAFARGDDPAIEALSQRFVDRSFEWLGDLHAGGRLNTTLRIAVPFQQWYRHIVRLTLITMPLKYPGRMLFLSRLADIGHEYLVEHGVFPPWMMDVIPIRIDENMVDGIPQEYIMAWHAGAANPFGTPAGAVMGEDQQFADWGAGMLNPMLRGFAEIVYGGLTGKARRMGGQDAGFERVKNQANNEISTWSSDGGTYYLNTIIRMLPLSSMAVTSAGQSAEGNLLLGGSPKLLRGSEGFLPAYALPPDVPGRDLRQLLTEFSWWNALSFATRSMVGGSPTYSIGRGPVMDSQFGAMLDRYRAAYKRQMSNIEKSAYQLSQTEAPAIQPVAPVAPPSPSAPSAPTKTTSNAPFFGSMLTTSNK